jgi:hypothetical protein
MFRLPRTWISIPDDESPNSRGKLELAKRAAEEVIQILQRWPILRQTLFATAEDHPGEAPV